MDGTKIDLYTEILPRLWLGGTENFDVVQELVDNGADSILVA